MDLRFGDPDRASVEPAPIDFGAFVATLAATQAASGIARAAAAARRQRQASLESTPAAAGADGEVLPGRRGAFHGQTAASLRLQASATELKTGFTLAFQPSFKPPV